jgi:hypothetical protein
MDEKQLNRLLLSIGKACFIKHIELFSDQSITGAFLVNYLMKNGEYNNEKYTKRGSEIRVDLARKIIREGLKNEAIKICFQSRIPQEWKDKASHLLNSPVTTR